MRDFDLSIYRSRVTTTEMLICPRWKTLVVPVSQQGTPGRDKSGVLLSLVWQPEQKAPTGTKGAASATWLAHTFVQVGVTNRDKRSLFFPIFLFSILFLFQLYFCISIKLMYWNSVCMISTNIYIYIYSYLYNMYIHIYTCEFLYI